MLPQPNQSMISPNLAIPHTSTPRHEQTHIPFHTSRPSSHPAPLPHDTPPSHTNRLLSGARGAVSCSLGLRRRLQPWGIGWTGRKRSAGSVIVQGEGDLPYTAVRRVFDGCGSARRFPRFPSFQTHFLFHATQQGQHLPVRCIHFHKEDKTHPRHTINTLISCSS